MSDNLNVGANSDLFVSVNSDREIVDYMKIFSTLPNFNLNRQIVINDCYNPTLYRWDGNWLVSWISEEGDSLLEITGNSPEDAVNNAVKYIKENYPGYYRTDYLDDIKEKQSCLVIDAADAKNLQSLLNSLKIAEKMDVIHLGVVFDTFIDILLSQIENIK